MSHRQTSIVFYIYDILSKKITITVKSAAKYLSLSSHDEAESGHMMREIDTLFHCNGDTKYLFLKVVRENYQKLANKLSSSPSLSI